MATSATGVLSPDDLNRTDKEVIDVLADGRVTPRYVADQLDVSRTYASERLRRLVEHRHVEKVAPGLYELVDDPRDESEQGREGDLEYHVLAAGEAIENNDVEALRRHVRAACEVINGV